MAREFDGASGYIHYGSAAALDNLAVGAAFSIHVWYNADTEGEANTGRIASKRGSAGSGGWLFFSDVTASLGFITVDNLGGIQAQQSGADNACPLNAWHSVVLTYDDNGDRKGHIYVDGSEIAYDIDDAGGAGQASGDAPGNLYIGNSSFTPTTRTFDGELCEVAIWNRVLSAAEIAALANSFSPLFFARGTVLYAPLIRYLADWKGNPPTQANAVITPHPPIIRPVSPSLTVSLGGAAAAAGTIYKTWDRFTTVGKLRPATGYPAAPAGGKAKMNAIGRRILLADVDERVLAIASDGGVPKETALLGAGSAWTAPDAVGAGLGVAPRIYPLTDQLWFAINGTGSAQQASGPGRRTEDGGATWGNTPDPNAPSAGIVAFARDAGDRIWCAVFDSSTTGARIYYSDDDGDNWSLSRIVDNGLLNAVWKILPHPTNQNTIAVISYGTVPSRGSIDYTLNRGSTWVANTSTAPYRGSTTLLYDAILLSNNRIVAIGPLNPGGGSSPSRVIYSDDWGATWTEVFSVAGANVRFSNLFTAPDGTRLGFVYVEDRAASPGSWHLMLSTDGGASFSTTALAAELETLWTTDFALDGFASTMAPERDALYCILRKINTSRAFRLTPISAAGVWTDVTNNLSQALDYNIKGMAVIPRAS